jgi:hypothetical protein
MKGSRNVALALIGFGILVVVAWGHPVLAGLAFVPDAAKSSWNAFGALLLVALAFERALEVYVVTFREPGSLPLESERLRIQGLIDFLPKDEELPKPQKLVKAAGLMDDLNEINRLIAKHSSGTRLVTLWLALVGGLIVSALGVRVLSSLVVAVPLANYFQSRMFSVVDVAVTGGLIAGGSKGIHAVLDAIDELLKPREKKA